MQHHRSSALSQMARCLWALALKGVLMRFYVRLKVRGDLSRLAHDHPRLILVARHSSHLDGGAILAAIPFSMWRDTYVGAARDYFFMTKLARAFFTLCMGAVPIDRFENRSGSISMCIDLLRARERSWLVLFPEGSRAIQGALPSFKRGVSLFAEQTKTPILFLHVEGAARLWPRGRFFSTPGELVLHVGPISEPAPIEAIQERYDFWVAQLRR